MDPDPSAIKALIVEALEECADVELLDLIYKLIIIEGQSP
jgi:hypothetical protein